MKIIDISWPLNEAATSYKDRKILKFEPRKIFERDGVRETIITIDTHAGTHVDAPAHFLKDGATTDQIHLGRLVGVCIVLDLTFVQTAITKEDLERYDDRIHEHHIVLLKTRNSALSPDAPFDSNFVYLAASGAEYLQAKRINAVGIDYLGIERSQPNHETHTICMENDILIIEGLRLSLAEPGEYLFCCLPLAIQGLDGSPARAVLITD